RLAILGGFLRFPPAAPHGTNHAGYNCCVALARSGRFKEIHDFYEEAERLKFYGGNGVGRLDLPREPPIHILDHSPLPFTGGAYQAIYAPGELLNTVSYALRPADDWVPIVCDIACAHNQRQWMNLFVAAATGALRSGDGLVYASSAARNLFERAWDDWCERLR